MSLIMQITVRRRPSGMLFVTRQELDLKEKPRSRFMGVMYQVVHKPPVSREPTEEPTEQPLRTLSFEAYCTVEAQDRIVEQLKEWADEVAKGETIQEP